MILKSVVLINMYELLRLHNIILKKKKNQENITIFMKYCFNSQFTLNNQFREICLLKNTLKTKLW